MITLSSYTNYFISILVNYILIGNVRQVNCLKIKSISCLKERTANYGRKKTQINLCIEHFNVEVEMKTAEETIREENHEGIIDSVIEELNLDDWTGDLVAAPRRVLREYESWMKERIDDEIDQKNSTTNKGTYRQIFLTEQLFHHFLKKWLPWSRHYC